MSRVVVVAMLIVGVTTGGAWSAPAVTTSSSALARRDARWARLARPGSIARAAAAQARRCAAHRCVTSTARSCATGPVLPVAAGRAQGVPGRVLPGPKLRSQIVHGLDDAYTETDPQATHYPNGALPSAPPQWRAVPAGAPLKATDSDATFNGEDARYRIAFDQSHYGVAPVNIGDFGGTGADALALSDHFASVDGQQRAGEVDVYYGERGQTIDPRKRVPDVVFYGDEPQAKFGISIARAGDVNGDGWPDLLIGAAFHSTGAGRIAAGGMVYLVYGGYLQQFHCTVKVRAGEIGRTIPGLQLEGGHDGRRYTTWANELDHGDADGDGLSDILIGAYNPYLASPEQFSARAYLLFGSRSLPLLRTGYHLGSRRPVAGIDSLVFEDPDPAATKTSLGFGASFVGDVTGSNRDALAFTAGLAGAAGGGQAYLTSADSTITGDTLDTGDLHLQFQGLESARPAGDVDADGVADILLTARDTLSRLGGELVPVGAAAVMLGRRGGLPSEIGLSAVDHVFYGGQRGRIGQPANDHGADFDGDGRADVLIADPNYLEPLSGQLQRRGRMWLIASRPEEPRLVEVEAAARRTLLADTSLPGLFGFTWDTGDFDGDGRPDLVVGDHYLGDHALDFHAGAVYLYANRTVRGP